MALNFKPKQLYFPDLKLWLDPHGSRDWAFVSHGHADHFANHQKIICSPGTGEILKSRYRVAKDHLQIHAFEEPWTEKGYEFCLYPAGHIAGSAMLHLSHEGESLLYTGDFKIRPSLTAEEPKFPKADLLVMETTFGKPQFVFPPSEDAILEILRFAQDSIADGETPVFFAYSLGKAQELIAILSQAGIDCVQSKPVFQMTETVRALGLGNLPAPVLLEKKIFPGVAVVAPPNAVRSLLIRRLKKKRTAMLSGWALTPGAKFRYQVDEVFPLSDHADYPGLLEAVEKVAPRLVYTLHGSTREFAADLRKQGLEAWSIYGDDQLEMLAPDVEKKVEQRHFRPDCELSILSDLLQQVASTGSRLSKVKVLAVYLKSLDDIRLSQVLSWLTKSPVSGFGPAILKQALLHATGHSIARYKVTSSQQNDSARTARLLLEEAVLSPERHAFSEIATLFEQLNCASGSLQKVQIFAQFIKRCHPEESETLVRLLVGGLRAGAREGLFEEAVAAAFQVNGQELRHAIMLTGDLGQTALLAKEGHLAEAALRPGVPLKPMLASPTESAEELVAWSEGRPLWLEPKYDGIRSQLHITPDGGHLFSRDLRHLDEQFPEILQAAEKLAMPECILDGELIAFAEGKKLTFFDLQKRLGRKQNQGDLFLGASVPVKFFAFDCLHHRDHDGLIEKPLSDRRKVLESLPLSGAFAILPVTRSKEQDDLEAAFKEAMSAGHEGLIAKDEMSPYQPGRRGKAWRKLKGVMPTLDCVVIRAQQGHGKRAGVLSDYTFAVRDEETDTLKVLGKAYSGLTDLEIEELTEHFQKTTIQKVNRRVFEVQPSIVLEIAFDKIRPSKRHDSGLALRFPRIKAIRRDKKVSEVDTLKTAQKLADLHDLVSEK